MARRVRREGLRVIGPAIRAIVKRAGASSITDSFNRANSTTTLGNTDTGQAWTVLAGTWGISSNQAYCLSVDGRYMASVTSGTNVEVQVWLAAGQFPAVFARASSSSAFYCVNWNSYAISPYSGYELRRIISGTDTVLARWATTAWGATITPATVKLRVVEGSGQTNLTVYVNGTSRITYADTAGTRPDGTGVGIAAVWGDTAGRWDDFVATAI